MVSLELRYATPHHQIQELVVQYDCDYDTQCWVTNEQIDPAAYSPIPPYCCYDDPWKLAGRIMDRGNDGSGVGIVNELQMLAAFQRMIVRNRELEEELAEHEDREEVRYKETHPNEF